MPTCCEPEPQTAALRLKSEKPVLYSPLDWLEQRWEVALHLHVLAGDAVTSVTEEPVEVGVRWLLLQALQNDKVEVSS
jgi:hypothetical protein